MSEEDGGAGTDRASGSQLVRGVLVLAVAVALGAALLGWAVADEDELATTAGSTTTTTTEPPTEDEGEVEPAVPVDGDDAADGAGDEAEPDEPAGDTDADEGEDPTVARQPGEVRVLVLNGSGGAGVAARGTRFFAESGYQGADPRNAPAPGPSVIYFAEGYELEARAAAAALGVDAAQVVEPLDPADPPTDDLQEAHLVVVAGTDGVVSF